MGISPLTPAQHGREESLTTSGEISEAAAQEDTQTTTIPEPPLYTADSMGLGNEQKGMEAGGGEKVR